MPLTANRRVAITVTIDPETFSAIDFGCPKGPAQRDHTQRQSADEGRHSQPRQQLLARILQKERRKDSAERPQS